MFARANEKQRSYRGFVTVVIGIIITKPLVSFGRLRLFIVVFVLRIIAFQVIIYVAVLYMNYPRFGHCAFSASFVREYTDVSYVAGEGVKLNYT